jgi:flagellar hook-length control protein FliK
MAAAPSPQVAVARGAPPAEGGMPQSLDVDSAAGDGAAGPAPAERSGRRVATRPSPIVPHGTVALDPGAGAAPSRAEQVDQALRLEQVTGLTAAAPVSARPPDRSLSVDALLDTGLATASAPATIAVDGEERSAARLVRGLSAMVNQRGGVMMMSLDPPDLGDLRIRMTLSQSAVEAHFQASTPEAQALLERNLPTLRHALEAHGLTVERLGVHLQPSGSGQPSWNQPGGEGEGRGQGQGHGHGHGHGQERHDDAGWPSRGNREHAHPQRHSERPHFTSSLKSQDSTPP